MENEGKERGGPRGPQGAPPPFLFLRFPLVFLRYPLVFHWFSLLFHLFSNVFQAKAKPSKKHLVAPQNPSKNALSGVPKFGTAVQKAPIFSLVRVTLALIYHYFFCWEPTRSGRLWRREKESTTRSGRLWRIGRVQPDPVEFGDLEEGEGVQLDLVEFGGERESPTRFEFGGRERVQPDRVECGGERGRGQPRQVKL